MLLHKLSCESLVKEILQIIVQKRLLKSMQVCTSAFHKNKDGSDKCK